MTIQHYTPENFQKDIAKLSSNIYWSRVTDIYAIPRGGIPLAVALSVRRGLPLVDKPTSTTLIVDDIIDSGKTRNKYPDNDFVCIHRRERAKIDNSKGLTYHLDWVTDPWVEYFWEQKGEIDIENTIVRQLQYIGENPNRDGLLNTPKRIVSSWKELFSGYKQEPKEIFTTFEAGTYNQIVLLKDIEVFSMCEHHILPFYGKAHIGYIPKNKVIGISKLARLVDIYARRLQIQERIGEQVTEALMAHLEPIGAACVIEAVHLCMRMRGCSKQHSTMVTSSLRGEFLKEPSARAELMQLIKS